MKTIQLSLSPEEAFNKTNYLPLISKYSGIPSKEIKGFKLIKKSVDARKPVIKVNHTFKVYLQEDPIPANSFIEYKDVKNKKQVIIIGAGPAGLFASLRLIEGGFKPIILERGKPVEKRKYDITAIYKERIINENSNFCFGEGGAGTYSDGKLYTRSSKRGNTEKIISILNHYGADESILYETHAHIGTDKLPAIVANIRKQIVDCGGEIHFNSKVTDFAIGKNQINQVICANGDTHQGVAIILAAGHSADDMYELLHDKNIHIEAKPFAIGFRVEHPQELIDSIQYHNIRMRKFLPASSYSLVEQIDGRGVFSFCMCPGGTVVPASTQPGYLVLNGMSSSRRNLIYANSGIVVTVDVADFAPYESYDSLAGLMFRREYEQKAYEWGGSDYSAPAQKMTDFTNQKVSSKLRNSSYIPGLVSSPLHEIYPEFIYQRLKKALLAFDRKMKGFYCNDALLMGVETRTSSPVRVPRDKETLCHIQIKNLYPCGEGAGYSGGIISSAIDGERCAEAILKKFSN